MGPVSPSLFIDFLRHRCMTDARAAPSGSSLWICRDRLALTLPSVDRWREREKDWGRLISSNYVLYCKNMLIFWSLLRWLDVRTSIFLYLSVFMHNKVIIEIKMSKISSFYRPDFFVSFCVFFFSFFLIKVKQNLCNAMKKHTSFFETISTV